MGLTPMQLGFSLIWLGPGDASLDFYTKGSWLVTGVTLTDSSGGASNINQS